MTWIFSFKGEFCIRIKPLGLTLLQSISTIFHIFLQVILGPDKMITVPPRHYCVVENPVLRDKDDRVVVDINGQIKLAHADQVIINNNSHITLCYSWDFTLIYSCKLHNKALTLSGFANQIEIKYQLVKISNS